MKTFSKISYLIQKYFFEILIFLILFFFISHFALLNIDVLHQGLVFSASMRILEGYPLFHPTLYAYGPIPPYLNAILMAIFGKSLYTIQIITTIIYSLSGVFLFLIWNRFFPKFLSFIFILLSFLLAPFLFWEFHPWSSVYALFFSLITLILLFNFIDSGNLKILFAVGILCALCFWSRQTNGLMLLISICIYLFIVNNNFKKSFIFFICGFLCFFILGLLIFFINEPIKTWINTAFLDKLHWAISIGGGTDNLSLSTHLNHIVNKLFAFSPTATIWGLLPVLLIIYLIYSIYQYYFLKNDEVRYDLAFIFVSIASWSQYFPVTEPRHLFWSALLFIPVPGILLLKIYKHKIFFINDKFFYLISFFYIIFLFRFSYLYLIEVDYRVYSGHNLGPTLKLLPAPERLKKFNIQFTKPLMLKGMKGSSDQVAAINKLMFILEKFDFDNGAAFECHSGWDLMCPYYIRGIKKNSEGIKKKVILSDSSTSPEKYILFDKIILNTAFAYCGSNPCTYYIYVEK